MYKFLEAGQRAPPSSEKSSTRTQKRLTSHIDFVGVGGATSVNDTSWKTKIRYREMSRYATRTDFALMTAAVFTAVCAGMLQPLFLFCASLYFRHAFELEYNCTTRDFSSPDSYHVVAGDPGGHKDNALTVGSSRADYERLLIGTCVAMIFFASLHPILSDRAAGNQVQRIKRKYFASIIRKDFAWFDCYIDRDLPHRIHSDIEEIRGAIGDSLSHLVSAVIASLSAMAYSIYLHVNAALIFICAAPMVATILFYKAKLEQKFVMSEQEEYESADALAGEILCNIRTVKQYEGEEKELNRYARSLPSPWRLKRVIALLATLTGLYAILPALCWYFVLSEYVDGDEEYLATVEQYCEKLKGLTKWQLLPTPEIARILLVHLGCLTAYHEVGKAMFTYRRIERGRKRAGKVFFVIDWKPEIDNLAEEGTKLTPKGEKWLGRIEFHAVLFAYPRNPLRVVLQDINFTILPGQMVTFFGKPMSGKSTIINLMFRFYDPLAGEVLFDGHNVKSLNTRWMRFQLSLIPQETTIFAGTVEDNIRLGNRNISLTEVVRACREADIHADIVSLPEGYSTIVGANSDIKLSANQIKKISLARLLLHPSRILVVDGFLPEIDEEFEKRLLEVLKARRGISTIILTSTKYNSIVESSDVIYTLRNGEIVDQGSPEEILRKRGPGYKIIQESKEFHGDFQPFFQSQLQAYKFAAAIKRKHDRRDRKMRQQPRRGSDSSPGQTSSQDKLLLQKNIGFRRFVTPRTAGGFIALAVGNIHGVNPHYFRNIINSALLRERDIRVKASRLRSISNRTLNGQSDPEDDISLENHEPPAGDYDRVSSYKPGPVSSGSTSSVIVHHRVLHDFESEPSEAVAMDFDTRIKHYFGWTVNSSAGTESISSEDSNAFWNAYSLSLAKALRARLPSSLRDARSLMRFSWPLILFGAFTSAIIGLLSLVRAPAMSKKFQEHIGGTEAQDRIYSAVFTGSLAFIGVVGFMQEIVLGFGLCCAVNGMRRSLLRGFLSRDIAWFDLPENDIGFLRDSLAADTMSVQMGIVAWVTTLTQTCSIFMAAVVLARIETFWIVPWGDLVVLMIIAAITMYIFVKDGQYRVDLSLTARRTFQQYSQLVEEGITYAKTVILLGLEQRFLEEHERRVALATKKLSVFHTVRSVLRGLAYTWKLILIPIAFAIAKTARDGDGTDDPRGFSLRGFILIFYIFINIFLPAGTAFAVLPNLEEILISAAQTAANIKHWEVQEKQEQKAVNLCLTSLPTPEITVHKVSFSFPTALENVILRSFSLKISPGQYVAIVGAAKSGKSCIVDLLNGLYHPTSGSVIMDIWNYRDIKNSCLRGIIGLVKQDPLFLNITLAENIAYGDLRRNVTKEEIVEAAKVASIHHLIENLSQKYDTKMSSLPENPSTFVLRQRLEIARAWIRQPRIILIDEATVSINPANDELLEGALKKLREGRTYVVTSQRIAPVRDADIIVVLQDGIIAEMGTDEELMNKKGLYYEIFVSQQLFEAKYATGGVVFQLSDSLDDSL